MTPKELQGLKTKQCSSCGKEIDTNYLVQPNESKRKSKMSAFFSKMSIEFVFIFSRWRIIKKDSRTKKFRD